MANDEIFKFLMQNMSYIVGVMGILIIVMYVIIIHLYMNLSYLKKRYKKMMTGVESGNLERMLIGHIDHVKTVVDEQEKLKLENKRIDALLKQALTKVGVVRFSAFEDMGGDLSYAVAMLDSNNNGVVFSSIFAREDSRSYVKPVENGKSSYALTTEEEEAIRRAMQ